MCHIHLVTGKLAAESLRRVAESISHDGDHAFTIDVLPITVAALMTPEWIARHICVPEEADEVLLPGYCDGDLSDLQQLVALPVRVGPRDLRGLPEFYGQASLLSDDYGQYDIEIIAEINNAPRLTIGEVLTEARRLADDGADVIDVGCDPGGDAWLEIADYVRALRDAGHRVSVDSLNPAEIAPATAAGAELVLSVNSSNLAAAMDWNCEVVAIPDEPQDTRSLDATVQWLDAHRIPFRVDPILEPIGFGFAQSIERYVDARRRFPDVEIMMGIGNLTELTDVDSAGVNAILLGLCQELGIRSVLTTQVINWARSSVRECDLARRLMHYAVTHRVLPKHVEPRLVMLRDPRLYPLSTAEITRLAEQLRDHNIRLFAEGDELHLVSDQLHLSNQDPFLLFEELLRERPGAMDVSHAFYLGYELSKALTALTLGKQYRQDEALDWGLLTVAELNHLARGIGKAEK